MIRVRSPLRLARSAAADAAEPSDAAERDRGSAPAEFVMVAGLLVLLVLGVIQLCAALLVRNTLADAAEQGAREAALADRTLADGTDRTREVITAAFGAGYSAEVAGSTGEWQGHPIAIVTVRAPLPVIGLFGVDGALDVQGRAVMDVAP